jgi:hypothetical protein
MSTTTPASRWTEGDRHWTEGVDPAAAQRLYDELMGVTGRLPEEVRGQLWRSEGFGSQEKNLQALVGDLQRKGVMSLSDLKVDARPIMEAANIQVDARGNVRVFDQTSVEGGGEWRGASPEVAARIKQAPEYAKLVEQAQAAAAEKSSRPAIGRDAVRERNQPTYAEGAVSLDTGKKTGSLINARTGEVIDDNKDNSPLEQGFFIGKTSAGKGKTHFNLFPVAQQLPDGSTSYQFIPGTEYRATGFNKFMQDFGPIIGVASLALGMPGVAAGMGTAGQVASLGLRGLTVGNAINNKDWLGAVAGAAGMVPGVNQIGNLGLAKDTLSTIGTIGKTAQIGRAVQGGDIIGALSAAAAMPQVSKYLPSEIGGVPLSQINKGIGTLSAAQRGDYLGAVLSALEASGEKTVPGTDISTEDARKTLGTINTVTGGALIDKQQSAGGSQSGATMQSASGMGSGGGGQLPSGLLALAAAKMGTDAAAKKARQEEEEKARREQEARAPRAQLFSTDPFGRQEYAGGGMVKRFAEGGFSDEDLWFFDNSDLVFENTESSSGDDYWAGVLDQMSRDDGLREYDEGVTAIPEAQKQDVLSGLIKKFGSSILGSVSKSDGSLDWAKIAALGGGIWGYNSAKDQDLSGIGFQGQIPQLAATRAQVPYAYDAERQPGSYGRRYMSDMYYAKPEDTAKIRQQAQEQAQGIAALQRIDGTMQTSIAPGGLRALPREDLTYKPPAPTAPPAQDTKMPEPDWLYKKLGAQSSAQDVANAYNEWASKHGGDTDTNKTAAYDYLKGLGMDDASINRAYDTYRGVPLDQYKMLLPDSDPAAVARAYHQYTGQAGNLDTDETRTVARDYLSGLGMSDENIQAAYDAYLSKNFAAGGIASLREPRYLDGPTNGQADKIQTSIDGEQPALLSHGEFVIPADVTAALGGGNSKAGAEALYSMMDRVRQQAFGRKQQMSQVNPNKVLPA